MFRTLDKRHCNMENILDDWTLKAWSHGRVKQWKKTRQFCECLGHPKKIVASKYSSYILGFPRIGNWKRKSPGWNSEQCLKKEYYLLILHQILTRWPPYREFLAQHSLFQKAEVRLKSLFRCFRPINNHQHWRIFISHCKDINQRLRT